MKKILLFLCLATILIAGNIAELRDLNNLKFEDAFEKEVTVPQKTRKVIVSFGKKSNSFMIDMNEQPDVVKIDPEVWLMFEEK